MITSNYYLIDNRTILRIGEVEYHYKNEFEVFIEKYANNTYDILINKLDREVFGDPLEYKFQQLSKLLINNVLPISLLIKEEDLQIRDGRNRTLKALDENREVVDCHGIDFDYIEKQFLDEMDTGEKAEEYFAFLNLIKILSIALQKQEDCENHKSDWSMACIAHTYWNDVKTIYDSINNKLQSISYTVDEDKLIKAINKKCLKKQIPLETILEKDKIKITSKYEHSVQYVTEGLDFSNSKSCVEITIDDVIHYNGKISIYARPQG